MTYKDLVSSIQDEIKEVLESVNEDKLNDFVTLLSKPNVKVLGYSAGRMGFGLKAFMMRLNHLGINAHWFGDNYVPPMGKDDVFICCSNSGTTKSVANIMDIFRAKANGKVVAFVGNEDSKMGKEADLTIKFKTCNGGLNSADDPSKINSIQPMTTLTEQAMFILFDIVALMLINRLHIDLNETKQFHSNIE
jgi:6-phospho-3-hexuloisomerase